MRTPDAGGEVVFTFSRLTWHAARARGMYFPEDRLAQALLDHPRVRRLVVANQVRSRPVVRARQLLTTPEDAGFPTDARHVLVQPLRLARGEPAGGRAARRVFAAYDRDLRRAATRLGLTRPAVITAQPLVAAFCALDWAGPVTYYAVDDWIAHPAYRRHEAVYRDAYARLRLRRTRVCAVSRPLLEVLAPTGPASVVPNGVEPHEWDGPPPAARAARGPLLAYVGTLDSRLDTGALLRLAADVPEATIVLRGPVTEGEHLRPLRAAPGIRIEPPTGRAAVVDLLRAADACLLPHVHSDLTEAMSPLKLYEYLAAGRPVVATDLPAVRGVDGRVVLVEAGGDFTAGVRRALAIGPAPEAERRAFVAANAWSARHEQILDVALA